MTRLLLAAAALLLALAACGAEEDSCGGTSTDVESASFASDPWDPVEYRETAEALCSEHGCITRDTALCLGAAEGLGEVGELEASFGDDPKRPGHAVWRVWRATAIDEWSTEYEGIELDAQTGELLDRWHAMTIA